MCRTSTALKLRGFKNHIIHPLLNPRVLPEEPGTADDDDAVEMSEGEEELYHENDSGTSLVRNHILPCCNYLYLLTFTTG